MEVTVIYDDTRKTNINKTVFERKKLRLNMSITKTLRDKFTVRT